MPRLSRRGLRLGIGACPSEYAGQRRARASNAWWGDLVTWRHSDLGGRCLPRVARLPATASNAQFGVEAPVTPAPANATGPTCASAPKGQWRSTPGGRRGSVARARRRLRVARLPELRYAGSAAETGHCLPHAARRSAWADRSCCSRAVSSCAWKMPCSSARSSPHPSAVTSVTSYRCDCFGSTVAWPERLFRRRAPPFHAWLGVGLSGRYSPWSLALIRSPQPPRKPRPQKPSRSPRDG
jgi:hypothetical protein